MIGKTVIRVRYSDDCFMILSVDFLELIEEK